MTLPKLLGLGGFGLEKYLPLDCQVRVLYLVPSMGCAGCPVMVVLASHHTLPLLHPSTATVVTGGNSDLVGS
jgi:hypothetical protein